LNRLATAWQAMNCLRSDIEIHVLAGEYTGHRECHLKPDLLLIYKKPDETTLRFVRLGSHSELF
jgi:mRNA interferase YafQ